MHEMATWPWHRCAARREPGHSDGYYGRCDARKGHPGPHWLERAFDNIYWSTSSIPELEVF